MDADCMRYMARPYFAESYDHKEKVKEWGDPLALYTDRELDLYNGVNLVDLRGGDCTVHTQGGYGGPRWQTCEEQQKLSGSDDDED